MRNPPDVTEPSDVNTTCIDVESLTRSLKSWPLQYVSMRVRDAGITKRQRWNEVMELKLFVRRHTYMYM